MYLKMCIECLKLEREYQKKAATCTLLKLQKLGIRSEFYSKMCSNKIKNSTLFSRC